MTPTTPVADRLILRRRAYLNPRNKRTLVRVLELMAFLLLMGFAVHALRKFVAAGGELEAVPEALWAAALRNPLAVTVLALQLAVMAIRTVAGRNERLVLTHSGIAYQSPWPAALQFIRPSWSMRWDTVQAVTVESHLASGVQNLAIKLDNGRFRHRIVPYQWVDPDHYEPEPVLAQIGSERHARVGEIADEMRDTAVLRYMAKVVPRFDILNESVVQQRLFAIHRNPRSLTVVLVLVVVVAYALMDSFYISRESYVGRAPWLVFAAIGTAAALGAAIWMLRGKVPKAEAGVIAVLFGVILTLSCYPGAMRLNAITDAQGLTTYEYQLAADLHLMPPSPELPVLYFPRHHLYWKQFNPGSLHPFTLRRGALGFYQIDMRPINAYLEGFYYPNGEPRVRR